MPSPFPGMDPYLEDRYIWRDLHHNLAVEIQRQLAPRLRPRYFAAVEAEVTYDEVTITLPERIKPDVSIMQLREAPVAFLTAVPPAPVIGQTVLEEEINLFRVEIREVGIGRLVTAIEILSPVNKRRGHEAFQQYQTKRRDLLRSMTHLVEIDLLRGGERWTLLTPVPSAPYCIFVSRANRRPKVEIWPVKLQEPIPIIPIPLAEPDPDIPLDLGRAIQTIYDIAAYDLRIDYSQPPPKPKLSPEEAAWVEERLRGVKNRD